ncbi:unnamed protein product [Caenorhabditis nigoni]
MSDNLPSPPSDVETKDLVESEVRSSVPEEHPEKISASVQETDHGKAEKHENGSVELKPSLQAVTGNGCGDKEHLEPEGDEPHVPKVEVTVFEAPAVEVQAAESSSGQVRRSGRKSEKPARFEGYHLEKVAPPQKKRRSK